MTYDAGVLTFATEANSLAGTFPYTLTASHTDEDGLSKTFDAISFDVRVLDCTLERFCAGEQESDCAVEEVVVPI